METLQILNRSEMKLIMAGYMNECAADCLTLYGGYLQQCLDTYQDPSSDKRAQCINEVEDLNSACLDGC